MSAVCDWRHVVRLLQRVQALQQVRPVQRVQPLQRVQALQQVRPLQRVQPMQRVMKSEKLELSKKQIKQFRIYSGRICLARQPCDVILLRVSIIIGGAFSEKLTPFPHFQPSCLRILCIELRVPKLQQEAQRITSSVSLCVLSASAMLCTQRPSEPCATWVHRVRLLPVC